MPEPLIIGHDYVADFFGCLNEQVLTDYRIARKPVIEMIRDSGLTYCSVNFHTFHNSTWSGVFILAESHVAFHTWQKEQGGRVMVTVSTCNESRDNKENTRKLFEALINFFRPTSTHASLVRRIQPDQDVIKLLTV